MPVAKIVILNWNGAEHLRRFLPSVVAAAPEGVGVVVADNGSTDDSVAILATEFPTVSVLRMDRNYGFAGGYNRALERIEADYYLLLNSDVETPAGWLGPILDCLNANPDVAVAAPKLISCTDRTTFEYAGASGGFIDFLGYPFCRGRILRCVEEDRGQYDDARDVFWVSGAAFCCRADVFRALGGFDADFFAHMEEIDLCWRMQLAGYRVRVVPQSTVYHLGGGTLQTDSPAEGLLQSPEQSGDALQMHLSRAAAFRGRGTSGARPAGGFLLPGAGPRGQFSGGVPRLPRFFPLAQGPVPQAARDPREPVKAPPPGISTAVRWFCVTFSGGARSAA